jgi:hypothetical protein
MVAEPGIRRGGAHTVSSRISNSRAPNPSLLRFNSMRAVASLFLSLQHTHQSAWRSSQDFLRSSSTVHGRPCCSVSSGVHSSFPDAGKNPQRPWFGSTFTVGLKSSRGRGSGMLDIDRGSRGPDLYMLLTPLDGLLSLVVLRFRLHNGLVVEK